MKSKKDILVDQLMAHGFEYYPKEGVYNLADAVEAGLKEIEKQESAESPRNEEATQRITPEIARLIHALKLAQSELTNINRRYYGEPVKEDIFRIIAGAIFVFEK